MSAVPYRRCDSRNMGVSKLCSLTDTALPYPQIFGYSIEDSPDGGFSTFLLDKSSRPEQNLIWLFFALFLIILDLFYYRIRIRSVRFLQNECEADENGTMDTSCDIANKTYTTSRR